VEPIINERLKSDNWGFIWYHDFLAFYDVNAKRKTIDVADLEALHRMPAKKRQTGIEEYLQS